MLKSTKAQVWYIDFIIGSLIFISTLIIFFTQLDDDSTDTILLDLVEQAGTISNALLTSGYPVNWTTENVTLAGLTDNNYRINSQKWSMLEALGYSRLKSITRSKYDFYFFLEDKNECIVRVNESYGIGYDVEIEYEDGCYKVEVEEIDNNNIVKITRLVIYDSGPTKLQVYVWN